MFGRCPVCRAPVPRHHALVGTRRWTCAQCHTMLKLRYWRSALLGSVLACVVIGATALVVRVGLGWRMSLPWGCVLALGLLAILLESVRNRFAPVYGPDRCRRCGHVLESECSVCDRCGLAPTRFCKKCGYDLYGVRNGKCPECGQVLRTGRDPATAGNQGVARRA